MRPNHPSAKILATALAAATILQTTSCAVPAPPQAPAPAVAATPPPPAPPPLPPIQESPQDWRNAPITPGVWEWRVENGQSVARFANGLLTLRCDRIAHAVTLLRAGGEPGLDQAHVPMTILTEKASTPLTGTSPPGSQAMIALRFSADDILLDEMAFSRGRFAVEAAGLPPLYVPNWPEISRVIEDCR